MLFVVGSLISFTLFYIDTICQKEIYKDMEKFLDLPIQDKIALKIVIFSLLLISYLFRKGRKWMVTEYGITCYYLLVLVLGQDFFTGKLLRISSF